MGWVQADDPKGVSLIRLEAAAQVAVKPNLFFENGYEYNPPGTPKFPTANQPPTVIKGAIEMSIFNSGTENIPVRPLACAHACMQSSCRRAGHLLDIFARSTLPCLY